MRAPAFAPLPAKRQPRLRPPLPSPEVVLNTTSRPPPAIDLTGKVRAPDQWQPEWIVKKYFTLETK